MGFLAKKAELMLLSRVAVACHSDLERRRRRTRNNSAPARSPLLTLHGVCIQHTHLLLSIPTRRNITQYALKFEINWLDLRTHLQLDAASKTSSASDGIVF